MDPGLDLIHTTSSPPWRPGKGTHKHKTNCWQAFWFNKYRQYKHFVYSLIVSLCPLETCISQNFYILHAEALHCLTLDTHLSAWLIKQLLTCLSVCCHLSVKFAALCHRATDAWSLSHNQLTQIIFCLWWLRGWSWTYYLLTCIKQSLH